MFLLPQLFYFLCLFLLVWGRVDPIYPTPPLGQDMRQGQFSKQSLTGLNSEFSFTKAEEPSLPYYLPIAGGRIIGFIPFPMVLVLDLSRIWTRVTVSISYDDNHYTTGVMVWGRVDKHVCYFEYFFFCFSCAFTNCSIQTVGVSKYFLNPIVVVL